MQSLTIVLLGLCLLTGLVSQTASAQLSVNKSVIELNNQESRKTVRLSNSGQDTLYINIRLHEVIEPGVDDRNRRPLLDPANDGILVHPRQLILEPGQTRSARVVLSRPVADSDRVFRLELRPLTGDALPSSAASRSAGVKTLLGYQLLVLARPDRLDPNVVFRREPNKLVFENVGNTSVLLRTLDVCRSASDCTSLIPNRLYPSEVLSLDVPEGYSAEASTIITRQSVQYSEEIVEYKP